MNTFEPAYVTEPLCTISNAMPHLNTKVEHVLEMPVLCTRTQNPAPGSVLKIAYQVQDNLLELFALDRYLLAFRDHATVRDMEFLVQAVATDMAGALGHSVVVKGEIIYRGVAQRQTIEVACSNQEQPQ